MLIDNADPSGSAYIPQYDFNGVAREGDTPDIGAYEYNGLGNPGWTLQEGLKSFELTGRQDDTKVGGCQGNAAALLLLPLAFVGRRRRTQ